MSNTVKGLGQASPKKCSYIKGSCSKMLSLMFTYRSLLPSNEHFESVQLTSVDLADGGDPDGGPDVDVPGDGGAPCEVPVIVVGRQLLAHVRLDNVHPLGQLHLARLLQEGREGLGEVLLVHVLHADGGHLGGLEEDEGSL